jgi:D-serine deaminase-like pyridoxal phosphate-dependent protein
MAGKNEVAFTGDRQAGDLNIVDVGTEVVATIRRADEAHGRYSGEVVAIHRDEFVQDVGRDEGVVHRSGQLDKTPALGQRVRIAYEHGRGKVDDKSRAPQMALSL